MRQFGYMHGISRSSTMCAPSTVTHIYVDDIFEALYDHVVPTDVRRARAPQSWSTVCNYIQWFYIVSHHYMTPDVEG